MKCLRILSYPIDKARSQLLMQYRLLNLKAIFAFSLTFLSTCFVRFYVSEYIKNTLQKAIGSMFKEQLLN